MPADTEVTDPKLLSQLEGGGQPSGDQEITDTNLLSQLNAIPGAPDAHHGFIERPGQVTPDALYQQPPPAPPPADPSFAQRFAAATPAAAEAAVSAAGGPLGVAPLVAGGAATLGPRALAEIAKRGGPGALGHAKDIAKIVGAGLVIEHLPGGEKIAHIFHSIAGGGEGGESH